MTLARFTLSIILLMPMTQVVAQVVAQEENGNPDPLERFNRPLFALNNSLDKYLVRPIAVGYDLIMPAPAQRGVGNFFSNIYDFSSALNAVLQGRFEGAAQSGGRFLVNSTVGVLGVFDVATPIGIRPYRTDFGHTLAIWGLPSGPYLMVPLYGPRTIRSGTGTIVDTYTSVPTYIDNVSLRNSIWGLELVDGRSRLLNAEQLLSGDRYIFVRDAYLQQRKYFISDGEVEDNFSDFDEAWDAEF
ncbi:MAG: phospholipid-binding lipoprotein MlaA [Alcanivorax sp.]|jgi:phospholipid-binding lipoprotein MlaA